MGSMIIREVTCKTALSRSGLPEYDYSLNPYRGCAHGCSYCYVPNIIHVPRKDWGCFVEAKMNIPRILAKQLRKVRQGIVGISTVTDPYQPLEDRYNLTRCCLEQLLRHDFPVSIITKSPLVTRDLDILKKFSKCEIGITVTTLDDDIRRKIEPKAPSIQSRLETLKKCSDQGIDAYVFLGPLYPSTEINELKEVLDTLIDLGINTVIADELNLKPGIWAAIENALRDDNDMREVWESRLFKEDYYKRLFKELRGLCLIKKIELNHQRWSR
jgi:DNA repair photolyase